MRAPDRLIWAMAALIFLASDPVYPLLIRGPSEWVTDFSEVNAARRLVWAGLYAVMALGVIAWRRQAWAAAASHAVLPLALLFFAASAFWSPDPAASALGLAQFVLLLAFGAAMGGRLGPAGVVRAVARAGLLALAGSAAMALLSPAHAFGQHVNAGALRGVYVEKNHLAAFLSYAFAAALFEALARPARARAWLAALALLAGVALARSSIALVQAALAIGLAAGFALLARARLGGAAAAAAALGAGAALIAAFPAALAALGEDATLNGRTELWALLWPAIEHKPLLGHGFFGFWQTDEAARVRDSLGWNARGAHSGWITALLFGGVVGASLWALHWAGVAARAARALRPGGDAGAAGLGALIVAHLVWSLFESNQLGQMNYHAVIAGLALALPRRSSFVASADAARRISAMRTARATNSGLPIT